MFDREKDCVAIDGPSGVGKSTIARALAKKLQIIYLDTGALYRAVGLASLRAGIDTHDKNAVIARLSDVKIDVAVVDGKQHVLLDGCDVEEEIRTPEAAKAASHVAAIGEVRRTVGGFLRDFAENRAVVMDGRDIGTHVLPNARYKFFLTASPEVRAKRRFDELTQKGADVTYERIFSETAARDELDVNRAVAPLRAAIDSVIVNTDILDVEGVLSAILTSMGETDA